MEVLEEVLTINPVSVLFPNGATARTPIFAESSKSSGTLYVKVFLNGNGKIISTYIATLIHSTEPYQLIYLLQQYH